MKEYIIGVDLGGTNIKTAIVDEEFEIIIEKHVPTEAALGPSHVIKKLAETVQGMLDSAGIMPSEIKGMGMGIPGLLNPAEGPSLFSPNFPGWENVHVVNEMKAFFDFAVYIDNDVRVNLYGEWRLGAGRGKRNLVLITLGTGLGSGIVMDGRVLYGTTSSAGEIGHMNMYREGRPCRCGSSGCLGRYVSAIGMVNTCLEKMAAGRPSVLRDWAQRDSGSITAAMISEAYDLGDPLAVEVMHETGRILGFGLANVINLFNPEMVIVGGGMSAAGDRLLGEVRGTVAEHSLQLSHQACRIVVAELGGRAGMIGAAAYARERMEESRQ